MLQTKEKTNSTERSTSIFTLISGPNLANSWLPVASCYFVKDHHPDTYFSVRMSICYFTIYSPALQSRNRTMPIKTREAQPPSATNMEERNAGGFSSNPLPYSVGRVAVRPKLGIGRQPIVFCGSRRKHERRHNLRRTNIACRLLKSFRGCSLCHLLLVEPQ